MDIMVHALRQTCSISRCSEKVDKTNGFPCHKLCGGVNWIYFKCPFFWKERFHRISKVIDFESVTSRKDDGDTVTFIGSGSWAWQSLERCARVTCDIHTHGWKRVPNPLTRIPIHLKWLQWSRFGDRDSDEEQLQVSFTVSSDACITQTQRESSWTRKRVKQ